MGGGGEVELPGGKNYSRTKTTKSTSFVYIHTDGQRPHHLPPFIQMTKEDLILQTTKDDCIFVRSYKWPKTIQTVKVSHSPMIAVGAVGVRGPLYLGHSKLKAEPIPLLSVPYPSLI